MRPQRAISDRPSTASLDAALLAILLMSAGLGGLLIFGQALEKHYIHAIAPEMGGNESETTGRYHFNQTLEQAKNQGMAFQRLAFAEPDFLPMYGSSELLKPVAGKANVFFRNYPTGFTVFPFGKPGSTCLILLEKIGAVADAVRGKRVVLSLSPSWFFGKLGRVAYEGNFSTQQATLLAFNPELSFPLKRDIARRMLTNERSMEKSTFLKRVLELEAGGRSNTLAHDWLGSALARFIDRTGAGAAIDRLAYAATAPLGRLVTLVYGIQDEIEITLYIFKNRRHWDVTKPAHLPRELNWDRLIADATKRPLEGSQPSFPMPEEPGDFAVDDYFRRSLAISREWDDLELLLRLLQEMRAKPLILSMPLDGPGLVRRGVSGSSVMLYSARLREIARRYGTRVEAFEDHIWDPSFLTDQHDHLGERGWMYYDRAIDAFFHGS